MKGYVIIGFAFLGVAFYQLSGGADFQPRGLRPTPVAEDSPAPSEVVSRYVPAARQQTRQRRVDATSLVARPAIAPDPVPTAADEADPGPDTVADATQTDGPAETAAYDLGQVRASLNQGLPVFGEGPDTGQGLTLASLEQGVSGLTTAPQARPEADSVADDPDTADPPRAGWTEPEPDIREITGSRVNMRDGPGTIYPVITKLTIGQEVEVIGESGTGWLRLRSLGNRQIGWVSASLVSKADN